MWHQLLIQSTVYNIRINNIEACRVGPLHILISWLWFVYSFTSELTIIRLLVYSFHLIDPTTLT